MLRRSGRQIEREHGGKRLLDGGKGLRLESAETPE
jgi:hypothetical protein